MICSHCKANISEWLSKYKNMKKIRFDDDYYREEKLIPKLDEIGYYITGERFFEHESKRSLERCPKCGFKGTVK
jgi:DNA-directed RNA polymerase subunit RPC12/RpoP